MIAARVTALLLAFTLSGCGGGAVHFISDAQTVNPPPPPPPPPAVVTDHFIYGQPSGHTVTLFAFFPSGTMQAARMSFSRLIGNFASAYWAQARNYGDTRFGVAQDIAEIQPSWWEYNAAAPNTSTPQSDSAQWLQSEIGGLAPDAQGGYPTTPVGGLVQTTESLAASGHASQGPTWVYFVDMRNFDFVETSQEQGLASTVQTALAQSLTRDSFSPFRYRIFPFIYLSGCVSDGAAPDLLSFLASYPTQSFDLCQLSANTLDGLAAAIHASQQRLVLSRVPQLATLVLSSAGRNIPRELIRYDSGANELSLTTQAQVNVGDAIEVTYETD